MTATPLSRPEQVRSAFAEDVRAGLSRRQKTLPAKWFYDAEGSRLFQLITMVPEYYPTRTEVAILRKEAGSIAEFIGPEAVLVEYGAGSSEKATVVAAKLEKPRAYVCLEIEAGAATEAARGVGAAVPGLATRGVVGDFTGLDQAAPPLPTGRRTGFFPGSTIGNFEPVQAAALMASFARHLGAGARLIVGFDQVKPRSALLPAYDDAQGVTAAFNKNVLARINRELDGNFDLDAFAHEARWNAIDRRIEMHLVSLGDQEVQVADAVYVFRRGESIHTENSYKFDRARVEALANGSGWRLARDWVSPNGYFSVVGFERMPPAGN